MSTENAALLAEAQFLLAQILWDPRPDPERAVELARLAARIHPDDEARAVIEHWLDMKLNIDFNRAREASRHARARRAARRGLSLVGARGR